MKKLLSILSVLLVLFACKKEKPADDTPSGGDPSTPSGPSVSEISSITLPSSLLLLDKEKTGGLLEVKLSPSGCSTEMLNVKVKPEDVVSWSLKENGVFFTPKKIGEASVTLSAKSGPASSVEATVKVLSSEDYASTAISNITLASSEVYLKEGDSEGKVIGVTLEPSSATSQMLKFSGATDLVSVSPVDGGIKFVPKKVGTGSVQIQPRKGSAATKSVAVVVLSKDAYSDYVISNISSSPASVELTDEDEATANVTLTLTPSAAALKDLIIASQDETVATVAKGSGTTLVVTGKKPGSTNILVRGIREGSKSIEIPVTVYGHVTSISFNAGERYDLLKGKTESLYYTIEKSGKMKNEPTVSWSATGSLVSVYGGKITGNAAGGDATYSTVTAKAGNCSASIKVYVYDTATGVEFDDIVGDFDLDGTSYNLKEGKSCSVTWRILPATAKQEYKSVEFVTGSAFDASKCISTVKSVSSFKTTITYPANSHYGRRATYILTITPSSGSNNKGTRYFYFTEFYSTDLKPGDYVYYDSASKRFNWSDGGLRRLESDFYFNTTAAKKVSGLGTFIGKVYATTLPSDPEWNALASKPGFKNKAGKHACVLSSEVALDTDNTNYFRWSEDDDDIFSEDEWTDGPHPDAQTEYALKFQLVYYNNRSGNSHKIKPGYAVVNMDVKTFGTAALTHTGWMVPTKETAEKIVALGHSSSIFKDLTDLGVPYDYWTATQSSKTEAWCFNFSEVQVRAKNPKSESLKPRLRPVLWL